jgi:hypothetical protein
MTDPTEALGSASPELPDQLCRDLPLSRDTPLVSFIKNKAEDGDWDAGGPNNTSLN